MVWNIGDRSGNVVASVMTWCLFTGQYRFCFNVPGDYFYWSGYVNAPYNTIYLRGQVTVTPRTSSLIDLKVKVGGVEAVHDTGKQKTQKRVFLTWHKHTKKKCEAM